MILNRLLPNATSVLAIIDELFCAFNNALRLSAHQHFARKLKANAKAIVRRKNKIAEKIAAGIADTKAEQAKVKATSIVGLNPGDLGLILFGKLSKDGYAALDAPIVTAFTKEKILEAHRKIRCHNFAIYYCFLILSHLFTAWS